MREVKCAVVNVASVYGIPPYQASYRKTNAMAEINTSSQGGGKVRSRKRSTKIDMTPMVDLAFLLLTFFILTTTFLKPAVLSVTMPEPVDDPPLLGAKNAFHVVLGDDDALYWWSGEDAPSVTDYTAEGIRSILIEATQNNPRLMVLIKPMEESRYQNLVDILDEMEIIGVQRYAIVQYSEGDKALLRPVLGKIADAGTVL